PRGNEPLEVVTKDFEKQYPNITISWDARSLEDFEDYPIKRLADLYDMILIDHPFMGEAEHFNILEPLDNWVDKGFLMDQKNNSVGQSFLSYNWKGQQWALP